MERFYEEQRAQRVTRGNRQQTTFSACDRDCEHRTQDQHSQTRFLAISRVKRKL